MCGQLLQPKASSALEKKLNQGFTRLKQGYRYTLSWVLTKRKWVAMFFVGLIICGGLLVRVLPTALMPPSNAGIIISVASTPSGTSAQYAFLANQRIINKMSKLPALQSYATFASGAGGYFPANVVFNFIQLKPWQQRKLSTAAVAEQITHWMQADPFIQGGARALDLNGNNNLFDNGAVSFYVLGFLPERQLIEVAAHFAKALNQLPAISGAMSSAKLGSQQYNVTVNRTLAMQLGVSMTSITNTVSMLFAGHRLSNDYFIDGESYPIFVQLPKKDLADFKVLSRVYLANTAGDQIPLSRLLNIHAFTGATVLRHINQMRGAELSFNVKPGHTLGQAISEMRHLATKMLPSGMQTFLTGQARDLLQGQSHLAWIFVLGLVFIYLVLAALFESFIDPLIILFTVPLCIIGAMFALWVTKSSLNVYTGIGLVTLIGLISKHGVLITHFANQRLKEGKSVVEAVVEAASIRLRPILMTTATMILGALPLMFAHGVGAAGRFQIGLVIVFGLLVGTFFSLWVVPVAYTMFANLKLPKRR